MTAALAHFGVFETEWELSVDNPPGPEAALTLQPGVPSELTFSPVTVTELDEEIPETRYSLIKSTVWVKPSESGEPTPHSLEELVILYLRPDGSTVTLTQYVPPQGHVSVHRVAAGMTTQMKVGDSSGLMIRGRWIAQIGSANIRWDPRAGGTIVWQKAERVVTLSSADVELAILHQFAESVE